jgi:hypothetical protein
METNKKQNRKNINPEILKAFELMWHYFPAPVFLLHRNRDIIGMNKAAKDMGILTGMKCFQLTGGKGIHEGCLGNAAMQDEEGKRSVSYVPGMKQVLDSYWLPIPGEKDLLIHFATDITQYARPELFPTSE